MSMQHLWWMVLELILEIRTTQLLWCILQQNVINGMFSWFIQCAHTCSMIILISLSLILWLRYLEPSCDFVCLCYQKIIINSCLIENKFECLISCIILPLLLRPQPPNKVLLSNRKLDSNCRYNKFLINYQVGWRSVWMITITSIPSLYC